jgi:hypothetical protein
VSETDRERFGIGFGAGWGWGWTLGEGICMMMICGWPTTVHSLECDGGGIVRSAPNCEAIVGIGAGAGA